MLLLLFISDWLPFGFYGKILRKNVRETFNKKNSLQNDSSALKVVIINDVYLIL